LVHAAADALLVPPFKSAYDPEHEGLHNRMQYPREIDPNFPRGRLMGSVICASTGLPLATAAIKLQAIKEEKNIKYGIQRLGTSDADGNFDFPSIPASTYYAFATLSGYASPSSTLPRESSFGVPKHLYATTQVLDAMLDKVTIVPDTATEIVFSLQVGGSISGTVFWQDGSPATNTPLTVTLITDDNRQCDYWLTPMEDMPFFDEPEISTDSDGNFKLAGLFAGKYAIGARVPRFLPYVRKNLLWGGVPPTINCNSSFYWTGNTPNHEDAVPVVVPSGTHISNVDLILPMLRTE
jgi:hypothetical protein